MTAAAQPETAPSTEPAPAPARGALVCLGLATLLAALGASIANIALPALAAAFDAPFARVQPVVVAYLAALTLGSAVAGRVGDRLGRGRALVFGLALFGLGAAACGLAPGLAALTAARAVQGAGAAFLVVLSVAMARDLAAEGRAGRVMGTLGAVSAIGTGLGPTLGGLLLAGVGWRAVFLALAAPAAAALALAWRALPRGGGEVPAAPPTEGRRAAARIWPGLAANLLVAAVMMTTLVVGPFFLGLGLGLSVAATGLAMSAGPAISALSAMPLGRLVDAWGTARARRAGLAAMACGALGLALAAAQPAGPAALAAWFAAIAALTPGYQLFQAANNVAALEAADPARRGAASGLLSLSRNIGLTAGASVMGWVFALGAGGAAPETANPETIAAGTRLTFVVAFALVLAAAALTHGERPEREATGSDGKP